MEDVKDTNDVVNHPKYYISETGLETIDVIEAFTSNLKGIEATDTGNILKYMCRWKQKNGIQDLKKARWYLNHLIEHIEKIEIENFKVSVGVDTSSAADAIDSFVYAADSMLKRRAEEKENN